MNCLSDEFRHAQADAFLLAARIAQGETSPHAPDHWNDACQRIAQRLAFAAARLQLTCGASDADESAETPAQAELNSAVPALN